ncbi:MAG TPA: protein kinase, partial [Candidatus Binatia bacterium]|nr:protein kinase [Candidatus Binatia bacterium]
MAVVISRKYEVLSQLGQGGMGVVYKVRHTTLDTILALKVLPRDLMENQEMVARFYREARVVARFNHPNIVRVSDNDHDETLNFHYFVMEYIQGRTFAQYLKERGPLPLQDVVNIVRQVAGALAYAHNHTPPVIHRDIKPANIMIEDHTGRVVVMDFGIAKELDSNEMTKSGMLLGTLKYCAPEQMRREPLSGSADIYSLGMVMYEAYAGKQFFAGLDETAVIGKVLYDAEEHEPVFARPAPPAFVAVVAKAIAKPRERRYQRVEDFLRDLEACGATPDEAERTILAVSPITQRTRAESTGDDLREIEEQIHRLEEERRKRLVLASQAQAREARERAVGAGAARWAPEVFQRGLSQEEDGNTLFRQQQYSPAQEAYEQAGGCFTQAYEETVAAETRHNAEQARQEMMAVKSEAERYGAREKARTFYGRALALLAKGDDLWEQEAYQQVGPIYAEARTFFADARDLAYRETFREEVAAAKAQARAAGEEAAGAGAEELSPEPFQKAAHSEQRAAAALSKEEFFQARELYVAARQQYEVARQQARAERQRRHAPAAERARQRMEEARTSAEQIGGGERFAAVFAEVHRLVGQGQECAERGEYIEAEEHYERARQGYERVRAEAEQERARHELQEKTEGARALVIAAKKEAQNEEAAELCAVAFREALDSERQADSALRKEDLLSAYERYLSATEQYKQAEQGARSERQRRRDLALQQQARKTEHAAETMRGQEGEAHVHTENIAADGRRGAAAVSSALRIPVLSGLALLALCVGLYVTFFRGSSSAPVGAVPQPPAPREPAHEASHLPSPALAANAAAQPASSPQPVPQASP